MSASETQTKDYIVTFSSSHLALKAEIALKGAGVASRLISAPRAISSECGFCLLLVDHRCQDLTAELEQLAVTFSHIYTRHQIDGVKHYAKQN